MADEPRARQVAAEPSSPAVGQRHDLGAGLQLAHYPEAQQALFEEADERGYRSPRPRGLGPQPATGAGDHPDRPYEAGLELTRALARSWPPSLRRHAALLALMHEGMLEAYEALCAR